MRAATAVGWAVWLSSTTASAQLHQPDGTAIPQPSSGAPSLQQYLDMAGQTGIDVSRDAAVTPERFMPGCSIRFRVLGRDSGYADAFGWYNVVPGAAPAPSDLHQLVGPSDPVGFTATLDFRGNPDFRGGQIGFYLRTPPPYTYYSERSYQPDTAVSMGFIHLLIYDSRVTPNAFIFAWEDLFGGGDNDFQDLLVLVDNLVCAGGGDACDTGQPGACAQGVRQCHDGRLACVQTVTPGAERCDGVDNDCNGTVDDGMGLCPASQVCDRGVCLDRCTQELGCAPGFTCTAAGTCAEASCTTVTCPSGEVCRGGTCHAACEGITCPTGQVCRVGRCVDPCAGLTCDAEQVCVAGVCTTRCPCHACPSGQACFSDGRCRDTACTGVTCPDGFDCASGACVDTCAHAVCPQGGVCNRGQCGAPPPDAGVRPDAGVVRDAGADAGVRARDAGSALDAGAAVADAGLYVMTEDDGGCSCRAGGARTGGAGGSVASLLALAAVRRRRRSAR